MVARHGWNWHAIDIDNHQKPHVVQAHKTPSCSVVFCTVLSYALLYCTVLYCAILYYIVLHCIILYWTQYTAHSTALSCTILFCNLSYTQLYALYGTVLYRNVPMRVPWRYEASLVSGFPNFWNRLMDMFSPILPTRSDLTPSTVLPVCGELCVWGKKGG